MCALSIQRNIHLYSPHNGQHMNSKQHEQHIYSKKIENQKFYKTGISAADARRSPFSWAVANRAKQEQTIFSELMYRSRNFTVLVSIVNRIGVKPKKNHSTHSQQQ